METDNPRCKHITLPDGRVIDIDPVFLKDAWDNKSPTLLGASVVFSETMQGFDFWSAYAHDGKPFDDELREAIDDLLRRADHKPCSLF